LFDKDQYEDITIYGTKEYATRFELTEYIDNDAPKTRQVELFGNVYDLTYIQSSRKSRSDLYVHIYQLNEYENATVQFDVKTGKIVKYSAIPFNYSMKTEAEFLKFINELLGSKYDLSEYEYECSTHYYISTTEEFRSRGVDGFHILKENEKLGSYLFYFSKSVSGIKTNEHIAIDIGRSKINLEIYDFGYNEEDYSKIIDYLSEIDSSIDGCLRTNLKTGYAVSGIEFNDRMMFIHDGNPYLITTSTITYSHDSDNEQLTTMVRTVTGEQ
jgi:hypothetical protein